MCSLVKINMDGIPIGRKIDLQAYDGYEKLASAVEELFRGLLEGIRHNLIRSSARYRSLDSCYGHERIPILFTCLLASAYFSYLVVSLNMSPAGSFSS